jgi:uncharacterized protein (TIGR00730 family)
VSTLRSICVYCGSQPGRDPQHLAAARATAAAIGAAGLQLVYGGASVGLMGALADGVLAAGGRVVGVIPETLVQAEVAHLGLTEQHVTADMHARKSMMAARADAFLVLPGGLGSLEELFEIWTWRQLRYHDKPIGLLNVGGYYDGLLAWLDQAVEDGFVRAPIRAMLRVDDDPARLLQQLAADAT